MLADRTGDTVRAAAPRFGRVVWHLVTGEYPPAVGGVSGYTQLVARALAALGDEVHVWSPRQEAIVHETGIVHHAIRLDAAGTLRAVGAIRRALRAERTRAARVLIQYVPQAFGLRAANLPFCAGMASLRGAEVWVMFHEVAVTWGSWSSGRRNAVAAAHRVMANLLLARADRVFVSIPSWDRILRAISPAWRGRGIWLPIPSNVPEHVPAKDASGVRSRLALDPEAVVIGHFGTCGRAVGARLKPALFAALRGSTRRVALLVGCDSEILADELRRHDRSLAARVLATGSLSLAEIGAHLRACNVLLQPYPDGVSTRRTSAMAGLALGIPVVTNDGALTEAIWRESSAVAMARSLDALPGALEELLANDGLGRAIGERGRQLYRAQFSLERTMQTLRNGLIRESP